MPFFESINSISDTNTSNVDLNTYQEFIPSKLRPPTGTKVKKAAFEEINDHLYDKEAKMAAFRVPQEKIIHYISALHVIFYDNVGNESKYDVQWSETPNKWEKDNMANAICIDVTEKVEEDRLFKVTFFITTGTIQVQGNRKDLFVKKIFPKLKTLANNQAEPHVQNYGDVYTESDETNVKAIDTDLEPQKHISSSGEETSKTDRLEENLLCVTDKMHTQITDLITAKLNDVFKDQQKLENEIKREMTDMKDALNDLKDRSNKDVASLRKDMERISQDKKAVPELHTKLEEENSHLRAKITQLEDKYKEEKKAHEDTKNKLKLSISRAEREETHMMARMDAKNEEIVELERAVQALKKLINSKEEELYKLKLHVGSLSDINAGEFSTVRKTKPADDVNKPKENNSKSGVTSTADMHDISEKDKKTILLIGTSNLKNIEPERWNRYYTTRKEMAYTLDNAMETIERYNPTSQPNAIVLHTLTNDIKSQLNAEGCVQKMMALINKTTGKFADSSVIVSMATPRMDSEERNNKVEIVNVILKQRLRDNKRVILCENTNLGEHGKPIPKFVENDGVHLTRDGAAMLGSNIKKAIDQACGFSRKHKASQSTPPNRRQYQQRRFHDDPYYNPNHFSSYMQGQHKPYDGFQEKSSSGTHWKSRQANHDRNWHQY